MAKPTKEEHAALYKKVSETLKKDRVYGKVADNTNMTRETVNNIANGKASPKYRTLVTLADYLGIDRDD